MSRGFQFKQFFIAHDRCAMKVNTDGILLGALADVSNATHIIDCGTGTGLVAIMLAQRAPTSQIIALEIEPNAYQQALDNARNSPFSPRILVEKQDILHFQPREKADLIVANPPYFSHSFAAKTVERDLARNASQSHLSWLNQGGNWLTERGKMSFILPYEAAQALIKQSHFPCIEQIDIITKQGHPPKRCVVSFAKNAQTIKHRTLTIYDEKNAYTDSFRTLTQAFYLAF